jgi:glycosyltransferase involved in cell wall biosynthesis
MVVLEAMAAGLPVITTDQGAIRETVLDGVNGFIVPKGDPAAIAEKIVLLLRDHDLRRRMGQASRERFLASYTLARWSHDMLRVFQEVLEEP